MKIGKKVGQVKGLQRDIHDGEYSGLIGGYFVSVSFSFADSNQIDSQPRDR